MLNLMGLPYPDIDADEVRELAQLVADFAGNVRETYEAATSTVNDMGSAYTGRAYDALIARWALTSSEHVEQLDIATGVVATALEFAADFIEMLQAAVLAELVAIAAILLAGLFLPGGSAASPFLAAMVRRILRSMVEVAVVHFAVEVVEKAIEPFEEKIDRFVNGALYDSVSDYLGTSPDNGGREFYMDPDVLTRYTEALDGLADEMVRHGEEFSEKFDRLIANGGDGFPGHEVLDPPADVWPVDPDLLRATRSIDDELFALQKVLPDLTQEPLIANEGSADASPVFGDESPDVTSPETSGVGQRAPAGLESGSGGDVSATPTVTGTSAGTPELTGQDANLASTRNYGGDADDGRHIAEPAFGEADVINGVSVSAAPTELAESAQSAQVMPILATDPNHGQQTAARMPPTASASDLTSKGKRGAGGPSGRSGSNSKEPFVRAAGRTPWSRSRSAVSGAVAPGGATPSPAVVSAREPTSPPRSSKEVSQVVAPESSAPPPLPLSGKSEPTEQEQKTGEVAQDVNTPPDRSARSAKR